MVGAYAEVTSDNRDLDLVTRRSAWKAKTEYYSGTGTDDTLDVVKANGAWYRCIVTHKSSGSFETDYKAKKWKVFSWMENLATDILLSRLITADEIDVVKIFAKFAMIDKALLAGAVCSDNKMFSQFGTVNGVNSENYTNENFVPNLSLDWRTGDMFARNGVYSGNMRIKFKHLAESDAIYDAAAGWWIVSNDVNLICGEDTDQIVVLNPEPKNDGMIITISNIAHPPYTKQGYRSSTEIHYPWGIAGVDIANDSTDSIPTSIHIIGGIVRLIGILEHPDDVYLKWTVLSNSKKINYGSN